MNWKQPSHEQFSSKWREGEKRLVLFISTKNAELIWKTLLQTAIQYKILPYWIQFFKNNFFFCFLNTEIGVMNVSLKTTLSWVLQNLVYTVIWFRNNIQGSPTETFIGHVRLPQIAPVLIEEWRRTPSAVLGVSRKREFTSGIVSGLWDVACHFRVRSYKAGDW